MIDFSSSHIFLKRWRSPELYSYIHTGAAIGGSLKATLESVADCPIHMPLGKIPAHVDTLLPLDAGLPNETFGIRK